MTGYKTVIVAALQLVIYIFAWPQLVNYVDPQTIALVASALMLILRFFTGTSVFKK